MEHVPAPLSEDTPLRAGGVRPLVLTFRHNMAQQSDPQLQLSILPETTVRSAKAALAARIQLAGGAVLELIYRDASLPDNATFAECNVQDGAALTVAVRIKTGGAVRSAEVAGTHPHLASLRPLGVVHIHTPPQDGKESVPKDVIREKALRLVNRGIAGLIVAPDPHRRGMHRVIMLNRAMMDAYKRYNALRKARGLSFLQDGSDANILCAMNGVLGEASTHIAAQATNSDVLQSQANLFKESEDAGVGPADVRTPDSAPVNHAERERIRTLQEKLAASKEKKRLALLAAIRKAAP
jgi:hypothetical protein